MKLPRLLRAPKPPSARKWDEIDPDGLKAVDEWLSAEITLAHQKKTSLETRSIAILSVSGVLGALYAAIQGQIVNARVAHSKDSLWVVPDFVRDCLIVGLCGAAVAIVFALVAIMPVLYREPDRDIFETEVRRALQPTRVPIRAYVLTGKIVELEFVSRANSWKAWCLAIAFFGFTAYVMCLTIGVVGALVHSSA